MQDVIRLIIFFGRKNIKEGRWIVVGRLRQSSASLHPPFGTSFLREPLTRPRPATLCLSLPTTYHHTI